MKYWNFVGVAQRRDHQAAGDRDDADTPEGSVKLRTVATGKSRARVQAVPTA